MRLLGLRMVYWKTCPVKFIQNILHFNLQDIEE